MRWCGEVRSYWLHDQLRLEERIRLHFKHFCLGISQLFDVVAWWLENEACPASKVWRVIWAGNELIDPSVGSTVIDHTFVLLRESSHPHLNIIERPHSAHLRPQAQPLHMLEYPEIRPCAPE